MVWRRWRPRNSPHCIVTNHSLWSISISRSSCLHSSWRWAMRSSWISHSYHHWHWYSVDGLYWLVLLAMSVFIGSSEHSIISRVVWLWSSPISRHSSCTSSISGSSMRVNDFLRSRWSWRWYSSSSYHCYWSPRMMLLIARKSHSTSVSSMHSSRQYVELSTSLAIPTSSKVIGWLLRSLWWWRSCVSDCHPLCSTSGSSEWKVSLVSSHRVRWEISHGSSLLDSLWWRWSSVIIMVISICHHRWSILSSCLVSSWRRSAVDSSLATNSRRKRSSWWSLHWWSWLDLCGWVKLLLGRYG